MKRIYVLGGVLLLLIFFSCQKHFLDQVPDDRLTIEQVFQRQDLSEQYLANIYYDIRTMAKNTTTNPWVGLADESDITYNRPEDDTYATYLMNLGTWSSGSNYYNIWGSLYQGIRSASYFIQHIGGNEQILKLSNGEDLIRKYTAEARFLRAFYYFGLIRQYGPVPILPDEPIAVDAQADDPLLHLARTPYDSCINYIVSELDKAAQDLPLNFTNQSNLDYGRITAAFCMAVKSRVLLYAASPQFNGNANYSNFKNLDGTPLANTQYDEQKWKRAADAAKDIIDLNIFSLYKSDNKDAFKSLRDVFLVPWNEEWIYAHYDYRRVNPRALTPRTVSGYASTGPTQQMIDAFEMANGQRPIKGYNSDGSPIINSASGYSETGFSDFQAPDDPAARQTFNMYVNREPRFYVAVTYANRPWINTTSSSGIVLYGPWYGGESGGTSVNYSRTGYLWRKRISPNDDPKQDKYQAMPNVTYRYAEVLLNYVEALNEYDPGNIDILKYLNAIRERAGVPQYGQGTSALPVPGNQADMRDAIHHERQIELCFEDRRYFDTRRWLKAEETEKGDFYGMNVNESEAGFYNRWIFETRVFHKNYYLFPIPQGEIDRDDQLVQNPDW